MEREETVDLFLSLVSIDSPSGNEEKMREKLSSLLAPLGCAPKVDDAGNMLFTIPGTLPGVRLFSAHMDTVEPGRNIKVLIGEDGVIRSDGRSVLGADDKDGITAIISALYRLKEEELPHPTLELLFTSGEEKCLSGSTRLQSSFITARHGWVFDGPGAPGTIYANGVGKIGFELKIKGKAAHAGIAPEKGINAFMLAAEGMQKFPPGRRENSTVNYGIISGGQADNIVPEQVTLTGEIRSSDSERLQQLTCELRAVWGSTTEITLKGGYPSYEEKDASFLEWTKKIFEEKGISPEIKRFSAGSDANHLARIGLHVCLLAMGRSDNHSCAESTRAEFIETMSDVAFRIMTCQDIKLNNKETDHVKKKF